MRIGKGKTDLIYLSFQKASPTRRPPAHPRKPFEVTDTDFSDFTIEMATYAIGSDS